MNFTALSFLQLIHGLIFNFRRKYLLDYMGIGLTKNMHNTQKKGRNFHIYFLAQF